LLVYVCVYLVLAAWTNRMLSWLHFLCEFYSILIIQVFVFQETVLDLETKFVTAPSLQVILCLDWISFGCRHRWLFLYLNRGTRWSQKVVFLVKLLNKLSVLCFSPWLMLLAVHAICILDLKSSLNAIASFLRSLCSAQDFLTKLSRLL